MEGCLDPGLDNCWFTGAVVSGGGVCCATLGAGASGHKSEGWALGVASSRSVVVQDNSQQLFLAGAAGEW